MVVLVFGGDGRDGDDLPAGLNRVPDLVYKVVQQPQVCLQPVHPLLVADLIQRRLCACSRPQDCKLPASAGFSEPKLHHC